jgi:hypothetical protein
MCVRLIPPIMFTTYMADSPLFDTEERHTLTFDEYSTKLIGILTANGAPSALVDAMRELEERILRDRVYRAPEVLCDSIDKTRLFRLFCDLAPEAPITPWQEAARLFFEENR